MQAAHALVSRWMQAAGMQVRSDAIGNLIGRYEGATAGAATLLIGSHLDTVKNAGKYDGMLGVLVGIAAVEALYKGGERLPFAIEVVGFSDEEGVRFGTPFLGSRLLAGSFDPGLLELRDESGMTLREAVKAFGGDAAALEKFPPSPSLSRGGMLAYLEVHIEQGPVLADLGQALGVVSAIVGQSRLQLSFIGQAGHAGTTPMRLRQDALAGAAEFITEVERYARATPGLVATVGKLELSPNAINVIPGSANLSLDIRHAADGIRLKAQGDLLKRAKEIVDSRNLQLTQQWLGEQNAVPLDDALSELLAQVAGDSIPVLVSGAGHDAMMMAQAMPSALLFVRSPNGVSHHPSETILEEDVAQALERVWDFLHRLGKAS